MTNLQGLFQRICSLFRLKCHSLILTFLFTVINRKNKHYVKYPDVSSAMKPLQHGPGIPIPNSPQDFSESESSSSTDNDESANDLWDQPTCDEPNYKQPKLSNSSSTK